MEAVKFDKEKSHLELLPPTYWEKVNSLYSYEMANWYFYNTYFPAHINGFDAIPVLEYGMKKYAPNNWIHGTAWSRFVGAFHRHCNYYDSIAGLWKPRDLHEIDDESGNYHGCHAECCRMFLQEYINKNIGTNDCAWSEQTKIDTKRLLNKQ